MLSFIGAGGAAPVLWRTSSLATTLELFLISWARTVGRGERDKDKEKSGKLRSTANCVLERQHSTAATGETDFCLFVASNLDFVETLGLVRIGGIWDELGGWDRWDTLWVERSL